MEPHVTTLERAFQLARSGACTGLGDVRQQLAAEGYSPGQISGRSLTKQLAELCRVAVPMPG